KSYENQVKFLLNNLALVHSYFGNYDKSLDYHFQSLKLREQENDKKGISVAFNNIGLVYYQIKDNEKALSYFKQALDILRSEGISEDIGSCLNNIGLAYTALDRHQEALESYNRVFELCNDACSDETFLAANLGAGLAYYTIGNYEDADDRLLIAKELAIKLNDKLDLTITNYYLAKIYYYRGNLGKAFDLLNEASETASSTDAQTWIMEVDNLYADLYEAQNDYQKAYFHKNRYSTLKDSIFNEDLIKNLANIQLDFQDQQAQEIIQGKDFQIQRRTQINLLLGGITLLISALLFILYKNVQLKKKANQKLAEANEIIENQNKELTNVNAELEERVKERTKELKKANVALQKSNEELDNFIYKTSHDIKGPLATLMGVCNIAQIDVKDTQALDYFDKLSITAVKLNEILSKLLTINQINNTALQPEKVDFNILIHELIEEYKGYYNNPKIEISADVKNVKFTSDIALLKVIYGNLISNAIKFRELSDRKESFMKINLDKKSKAIVFRIVDNGTGISEQDAQKIFEVFSKGTDMADSSGIGLYLVKLSVEKLHGDISHGKTDEGHTYFEVALPA
ncbi:sensor histidine kinase, partial [Fulvivirga sp. RKSG066]|uniref:tetratricopeptide repeat-containing sensor histidine kinase n=1 Tax=Fulvivirga aurantia TaxID=2529383 RepID=UPI0012BCB7C9